MQGCARFCGMTWYSHHLLLILEAGIILYEIQSPGLFYAVVAQLARENAPGRR